MFDYQLEWAMQDKDVPRQTLSSRDDARRPVRLKINGEIRTLMVEARMTLLEAMIPKNCRCYPDAAAFRGAVVW